MAAPDPVVDQRARRAGARRRDRRRRRRARRDVRAGGRRDRRRDADAARRRHAAAEAAPRRSGRRRYTAALGAEQPGLYRVHAEARRGATTLGTADRWLYVGGADREFADPRLNEGLLRRLARASGGRYVRAADASRVAGVARGGGAAERRARAPRSLARALGVCADRRAAVGGVDPAPPLGAAMIWNAKAAKPAEIGAVCLR